MGNDRRSGRSPYCVSSWRVYDAQGDRKCVVWAVHLPVATRHSATFPSSKCSPEPELLGLGNPERLVLALGNTPLQGRSRRSKTISLPFLGAGRAHRGLFRDFMELRCSMARLPTSYRCHFFEHIGDTSFVEAASRRGERSIVRPEYRVPLGSCGLAILVCLPWLGEGI